MTDHAAIDTRKFGFIDVQRTDVPGAVAQALHAIEARVPRIFSFCNAATVNLAHNNPAFASALDGAVLYNDGIGLDVASIILYGSFFPQNLNGTDLMPEMLRSARRTMSIYLVGSLPGVAEEAGRTMESLNPNVRIVGTRDGYFDLAETPRIVEEIAAAKPDVVFVGMGQPRQELWSASVIDRLGVPMICFGAFMDFASGRMPRAPRMVRALRIEWLYRLMLEPRRLFGRYVGGAIPYLLRILAQRFRGR